jgi:hypothetical protein
MLAEENARFNDDENEYEEEEDKHDDDKRNEVILKLVEKTAYSPRYNDGIYEYRHVILNKGTRRF